MKKVIITFLLVTASLVTFAQRDYARFAKDIDGYSRGYSSNDVVMLYQNHYGIPQSTLIQLYGLSGNSWGNVVLGLEMSHFLGIPIGDIFHYYDGEQGWGVMAKRYGIKPGSAKFHRMKSIMGKKNSYWRGIYRDYDKRRDPVIARKGAIVFGDGMIILNPSSKDVKKIHKDIDKRNKQIYKNQRKREKEWDKSNKKIRKERKKQQKRYDKVFD